jgi:hypothetical protein
MVADQVASNTFEVYVTIRIYAKMLPGNAHPGGPMLVVVVSSRTSGDRLGPETRKAGNHCTSGYRPI